MEVGLEGQKCRPLEEEIYWKHFNSLHFCQILPEDFHERLVLPLKFAENMITELPDKVSLFGPSGAVWDVDLMKTNNAIFVGNGWKEFVKAYDLEASCLLVFRYKRNVGFEVLILDPVSLCEKEAAYFVKKHDHMESNHPGHDKKRSLTEAFGTELIEGEESDDNDSDFVVSKKVRKDAEGALWVGEKNNLRHSRKCSSVRVTRGSKGRGRSRGGRSLKPASNLKTKSGVGRPRRNKAAEEKPVMEIGGSTLEMGHSHESSEIRGKKPNGNEGAEEQNNLETGRGTLEVVRFHKSMETRGKKPNGDEPAKDQSKTDNGESTLGNVNSLKCYETRGKKPSGCEAAKEQKRTEIRESIQEMVHSHKSIEIGGNKANGIEAAKEQNGPETVPSDKARGGRGRPKKQVAPTSSKDLFFENGKKSNMNEAEEQNSPETGGSTLDTVNSNKSPETKRRPKKQITPNSSKKLDFESDSAMRRFAKEFVSKRRPVTEIEKENALQRARQEQTEKSFIAVMRPTAVYKRFYLNIPTEWVNKFLPHRNQEVVFRVGEKTWSALFYYYNQKGGGVAGAGWKNFVLDHNLEEFDVCLFKLTSQKEDPTIVFDVDIFRVIPEIVSPGIVAPRN